MRVAVLGSSGQIGAYLTEHLTKKGHLVREFDVVNGYHEDMTHIPNVFLRNVIMESDFVFFLAFDVGGSRYLKKYQHTFDFINNNTRMMVNAFGLLEKYKKPFVFASSQMSNLSFSSYGILKNVGELYTKSLGGLVTKFWNVYGIEKDYEKSHVITDFIRKGFESGVIDMITDGQEEREFLYAQDCCDALEIVMNKYNDFKSDDELHVTSFNSIKIIDIAMLIQQQFSFIGKKVDIKPSIDIDTVQQNSKNIASKYLLNWWTPSTTLDSGIAKVFTSMKKYYD
tara:strand:- start:1991 stop:2839 length:849 start_codon:yes stop_codon:yes gene_type:complete